MIACHSRALSWPVPNRSSSLQHKISRACKLNENLFRDCDAIARECVPIGIPIMTQQSSVEIDLVYLWVNASDRVWIDARRDAIRSEVSKGDTRLEHRLAGWSPAIDHGELRLALRSTRHAPWIRHIWIVTTGGQSISWLDTEHPNITLVDGDALLRLAGGAVPSFNNHALYLAMHLIDGLSETFVNGDDDVMFMPSARAHHAGIRGSGGGTVPLDAFVRPADRAGGVGALVHCEYFWLRTCASQLALRDTMMRK